MCTNLGWRELEGSDSAHVGVSELSKSLVDFVREITPIFILRDGVYLLSNSEKLADKTIIFELSGESQEIYLTGPISLRLLSELIYSHLNLNEYISSLVNSTEKKLREMISGDMSLELIEYSRYVEFMLRLIRKELGKKLLSVISKSDIYVYRGNIEEALVLIQNEKNKSMQFLHSFDVEKLLLPEEGRIRVIVKRGMFEYTAKPIGPDTIKMIGESKRVLNDMDRVCRILLLLAFREVEKKRIKLLSRIESRIKSGLLTSRQYIFALTRKLIKDKRLEFPVEVDGIRTYIGLRLDGKNIYAFLSTGEYVIREVLNKRKFGVFVYFPPVDICVKLQSGESEDGRIVVYPVEAPVIIDEYDHPSIRTRRGERTICLGALRGYVDQIINAAKDVATKGKNVEIKSYGVTIISPEQALKEVLLVTFRVMRYGYVPGANPYKHAVNCSGFKGIKIVNSDNIIELKRRGVEIVDPLSE